MFGSAIGSFPRLNYNANSCNVENALQSAIYAAVGPTVVTEPQELSVAIEKLAKLTPSPVYHLYGSPDFDTNSPDPERRLIDQLDDFRSSGGQVIWSRTRILARDDKEAALFEALSSIVSVVHIPSWEGMEALNRHEGDAPINAVVISAGPISSAYKMWSRTSARRQLKLSQDAHVFLMANSGYDSDLELEASLSKALDDQAANNVLLVHDKDHKDWPSLQICAADTVIIPATESSLNSSFSWCAAGFGRGILGPDVVALRDGIIQCGRSGLLFSKDNPEGAIEDAVSLGIGAWADYGNKAAEVAAARSWTAIGRQWRDLIYGLSLRPRFRVKDAAQIVKV